MNDAEFLQWVHDKLHYQHGDPYDVDFMHRLRKIISEYMKKCDKNV